MNHLVILLRVSLTTKILFNFVVVSNAKLTAINDSSHALHLYHRLKNEDPPTEADSALTNIHTRQRICEEITNSGFFDLKFSDAVAVEQGYRELRHPRYSNIRHQIYKPTESRNSFWKLLYPYEYVNPYTRRQFILISFADHVRIRTNEFVFVCLLKSWITKDIIPYYVSKEYNVFGEPYMAGRFVFGKDEEFLRGPRPYYNVLLAEEPAVAYTRADYDVELHYLEVRKHREPAQQNYLDPLYRVIPPSFSDNQSYRLCVQIFRSAYFKDRIDYPLQWLTFQCHVKKVSFKTEKAIRQALGKSYYELMTRCDSTIKYSTERISYYVSRAYSRNQVFVYNIRSSQEGIEEVYLENLFTNVSVVNEHIGFDDVE